MLISAKHDIYKLCSRDEDFVRQSFIVGLEVQVHFWDFFNALESLIVSSNLKITQHHHTTDLVAAQNSLKFLYEESLLVLVDHENLDLVSDVLNNLKTHSSESGYSTILSSLKKNSPVLMAACKSDNYELVKILVQHDCRFITNHLENKLLVDSRWDKYTQILTMFSRTDSTQEKSLLFEGRNDILF